jgi:hypothetical protein
MSPSFLVKILNCTLRPFTSSMASVVYVRADSFLILKYYYSYYFSFHWKGKMLVPFPFVEIRFFLGLPTSLLSLGLHLYTINCIFLFRHLLIILIGFVLFVYIIFSLFFMDIFISNYIYSVLIYPPS